MAGRAHRKPGFRPDKLVDFLEVAYDFELDDQTWLVSVMRAAREVSGRGGPMHGAIYDASDVAAFRFLNIHVEGFTDEGAALIMKGTQLITPALVARTFRSLLAADADTNPAYPEMRPMHDGLAALGLPNALYLNGMNPDGRGTFMGLWKREPAPLPPAEMAVWRRIAHHLGAAHRCRERLRRAQAGRPAIDATEGAEAILDARCRILHATGRARSKGARATLVETSRARDRARVPRRSASDALGRWRPLTAARWTLVDSFERGGARYIVARENLSEVTGLAALSDRERQVVAYTALGQSTKETAYALGISGSTARVLLARAAAKLGTKTRAALLAHPEVRTLRPGAGAAPRRESRPDHRIG